MAAFTSEEPLAHLWLVVMGAPTRYWKNYQSKWPYAIKVTGAALL